MRSKIAKAMEKMLEASKCAHQFEYLKDHPMDNGVVGRCLRCRCRFTVWPGSVHYEDIVRARDAQTGATP